MTLTIGLIGCGRWGTIHHATLMSLKQEGYLDRLIVCDIDATARDAVEADAHYASIDAMLTSEQLDGVAIVTPPETHLALARQALAVNLPVFVEKPLGASGEEETSFLSNLPKDVTVMVGYLLRYHAGLNRIKAAIDDRAMNIETLSYRRRTTRTKPLGADPLATLAVHGLDTARYLTGGVLAEMEVRKLEVTDSSANIWLWNRTSLITIDVAWEAEEEQRTLAVQGTTSGAVLDFGTGEVAWYAGTGEDEEPLVEHFPSQPLREEWLSFLRRVSDELPGIVPEPDSLLDVSAWLSQHGPVSSPPR